MPNSRARYSSSRWLYNSFINWEIVYNANGYLANFKSKEGYWHDRNIFREVIKDILNVTEAKNMLEIGFNIGYSASMWLEFDVNKF